jgi:hypothetical protein
MRIEMMIASGPTLLSRLVWPDIENAQQTGCSDFQPAELDLGPAKAFVTASGLSLSPALTLCHYRSYILRVTINRGGCAGQIRTKSSRPVTRNRFLIARIRSTWLGLERIEAAALSHLSMLSRWWRILSCIGGTQAAVCLLMALSLAGRIRRPL